MSEPRLCLVGATGLVGGALLAQVAAAGGPRVLALARRPIAGGAAGPVSVHIGDAGEWPALIAGSGAQVLVCTLGTTLALAGSREAFRAVDHDLVLACARAARGAGVARMIFVSSAGANARSRAFYLSVKGEVEEALAGMGFDRLDFLRPGMIIGPRERRRPGEAFWQAASPVIDRTVLHGPLRRYRSVPAAALAGAILTLAGREEPGRFVHDAGAILAASGAHDARG